ncbi:MULTISPECIES: hypothetical protein [Rickettsieae]|uniref:hypothetical protein n=1 Tax=Rickettsieae TaxID=33988 RepID=UPI000B9AA739|nr:hypothetical protein [Rickettsia endosymbiont of Culicoides newsteadi]OZG31352.1 hypothetical protein RiCNE_12560 [Rickettsia endosymbiont of Culicoides newsteadi]
MFGVLEVGRGIQVLYEYVKAEILESDFFALQPKDYQRLEESERDQKWYMLNPEKLNKNYIEEKAAFLVNEREKYILLRAVHFINTSTAEMPVESSFLERLLYTKKFVPSCFFSSKPKTTNNDSRIIQLHDKV